MENSVQTVSDLGALIRDRRRAHGYTQAGAAALCGTGVRFISDLENGKPTVAFGKALLVAQSLGIDLLAHVRGTNK